jgi:hypothetical protein
MAFSALTRVHGDKNKLYHSTERVFVWQGKWSGYKHVNIDDYMRLCEDKELGVYSFIMRARKVLLRTIIFWKLYLAQT